jgi:hypothetical protein
MTGRMPTRSNLLLGDLCVSAKAVICIESGAFIAIISCMPTATLKICTLVEVM